MALGSKDDSELPSALSSDRVDEPQAQGTVVLTADEGGGSAGPVEIAVPAEFTSVVDLGDDLLEKTAQISVTRADFDESGDESPQVASSLVAPLAEATPTLRDAEPSAIPSDISSEGGGVTTSSPLQREDSRVLRPDQLRPTLEPESIFSTPHEAAPLQEPGLAARSPAVREDASQLWKRLAHEVQLDELLGHSPQFFVQEPPDSLDPNQARLNSDSKLSLGISFLEMGAFHDAIQVFESVARTHSEVRRESIALLGQAKFKADMPFEALIDIQSAVADPDDGPNDEQEHLDFEQRATTKNALRLELCYWAGRCCEVMAQRADALIWYGFILSEDPLFRDTALRVKEMTGLPSDLEGR
jgi:hypothetical protein